MLPSSYIRENLEKSVTVREMERVGEIKREGER